MSRTHAAPHSKLTHGFPIESGLHSTIANRAFASPVFTSFSQDSPASMLFPSEETNTSSASRKSLVSRSFSRRASAVSSETWLMNKRGLAMGPLEVQSTMISMQRGAWICFLVAHRAGFTGGQEDRNFCENKRR